MIRFMFKPCLEVRVLKWSYSNEMFKKNVTKIIKVIERRKKKWQKNKGGFLILAVIPM